MKRHVKKRASTKRKGASGLVTAEKKSASVKSNATKCARMGDLCEEDKQKIGRLMLKVVQQGKMIKQLESKMGIDASEEGEVSHSLMVTEEMHPQEPIERLNQMLEQYKVQNALVIQHTFGIKTKFRKAALLLKGLKVKNTATSAENAKFRAELIRANALLRAATQENSELRDTLKRSAPEVDVAVRYVPTLKELPEMNIAAPDNTTRSSSHLVHVPLLPDIPEEALVSPLKKDAKRKDCDVTSVSDVPEEDSVATPEVVPLLSPDTKRILYGKRDAADLTPRTKSIHRLLAIQNQTEVAPPVTFPDSTVKTIEIVVASSAFSDHGAEKENVMTDTVEQPNLMPSPVLRAIRTFNKTVSDLSGEMPLQQTMINRCTSGEQSKKRAETKSLPSPLKRDICKARIQADQSVSENSQSLTIELPDEEGAPLTALFGKFLAEHENVHPRELHVLASCASNVSPHKSVPDLTVNLLQSQEEDVVEINEEKEKIATEAFDVTVKSPVVTTALIADDTDAPADIELDEAATRDSAEPIPKTTSEVPLVVPTRSLIEHMTHSLASKLSEQTMKTPMKAKKPLQGREVNSMKKASLPASPQKQEVAPAFFEYDYIDELLRMEANETDLDERPLSDEQIVPSVKRSTKQCPATQDQCVPEAGDIDFYDDSLFDLLDMEEV